MVKLLTDSGLPGLIRSIECVDKVYVYSIRLYFTFLIFDWFQKLKLLPVVNVNKNTCKCGTVFIQTVDYSFRTS